MFDRSTSVSARRDLGKPTAARAGLSSTRAVRLGLLIAKLALLVTLASTAAAEVLIGVAAPLTGSMAGAGGDTLKGAELALNSLNAAGGLLGEQVRAIVVDDHCDGEQAVAAAQKLVQSEVVAVIGHQCSGAAIPASRVYADAGILMISDFATNPQLTEQGFHNVFRVVGRDDLQGRIAGDLLADRWAHGSIAILHDGEAYGRGLASEAKKRLNQRGVVEVMFGAVEPGRADYSDVIERLENAGVQVLYYGGYMQEAALIVRQAADRGYAPQLIEGDGIAVEDFALIAGPASEGTLMTLPPSPAIEDPKIAALAESASVLGVVNAHSAVQVWAKAVEAADSFVLDAVAQALRSNRFDTMLGTIGFDEKGDVTDHDSFVWYVWKDGAYAPLAKGGVTN